MVINIQSIHDALSENHQAQLISIVVREFPFRLREELGSRSCVCGALVRLPAGAGRVVFPLLASWLAVLLTTPPVHRGRTSAFQAVKLTSAPCRLWSLRMCGFITASSHAPSWRNLLYFTYNTSELNLSGLIGMPSHLDMQKTRIIGFFSENRIQWQFAVQLLLFTVCTYIQTFDHSGFEL